MLVARFGQIDPTGIDIGTEANPIRITPSGTFPSETQSDLGPGIDTNQVIDIAPSQNQEPAPIRLPPITITAPSAPSAPSATVPPSGLSTGQIALIGVGATVAAVVIIAALVAKPVEQPRRQRRRTA